MKTVILDGKEYVLVPKEQLQPVEQPVADTPQTTQDAEISPLNDFMMDSPIAAPKAPLDDGLATQEEKEKAIQVIDMTGQQDVVTEALPSVPKAQPKKYEYRERFIKKELMPSDVMTFSRVSQAFLDANPEDPMIKADSRKPKSQQLFYGPATQTEGY